jgi:hypothetical protein
VYTRGKYGVRNRAHARTMQNLGVAASRWPAKIRGPRRELSPGQAAASNRSSSGSGGTLSALAKQSGSSPRLGRLRKAFDRVTVPGGVPAPTAAQRQRIESPGAVQPDRARQRATWHLSKNYPVGPAEPPSDADSLRPGPRSLRLVSSPNDAHRTPWNGSWNGASDSPGTVTAVSAMICPIGAASAIGVRRRTSCKR